MDQDQLVTAITRDPRALQSVAERLSAKFARFAGERRGAEKVWMQNLRQYLGKYDPEIESRLDKDRSHTYPRLTRVKVVSLVSRLMALLFPTGEKNWGLGSSAVPDLDVEGLTAAFTLWAQENPDAPVTEDNIDRVISTWAINRAKKAETVIDDQLRSAGGTPDVDYVALVRKVVFSAVLYSVGVLRGPMTKQFTAAKPKRLPNGQWTIEQTTAYTPFFEFVSVWDYFPDMSAKDFASMDGQFERHVLTKAQLTELKARPDYFGNEISSVIAAIPDGNWVRRDFEGTLAQMANNGDQAVGSSTTGKYEVLSYTGPVSGSDFAAAGGVVKDTDLDLMFEANVWVVKDTVIKFVKIPFPSTTKWYHQFVFEEDEVNLMGSGLPPIMRDSQLAVCSASRMLMDNAAVCCGPQLEVDLSRLRSDQDIKTVTAFKIWYLEGDTAYNNTSGRAINNVSIDSHIGELLQVIDLFRNLADTETFVGPTTGGDMESAPSEPMRTTAGASMILGNSALPFRDIVRNFDSFTMSVIDALYQWNLAFNGTQVQGDLQPVARGATSLIAKEVRAIALDNLANTLTDEEKDWIDWGSMIKNRIQVRDLTASEVLVSDEEAKRRADAKAQAQQSQLDLATRNTEAVIRDTLANAFKNIAQGKKNLGGAQISEFQAVVASLEKGIDPNVANQFTSANQPQPAPAAAPQDVAGMQGQPADAGAAGVLQP